MLFVLLLLAAAVQASGPVAGVFWAPCDLYTVPSGASAGQTFRAGLALVESSNVAVSLVFYDVTQTTTVCGRPIATLTLNSPSSTVGRETFNSTVAWTGVTGAVDPTPDTISDVLRYDQLRRSNFTGVAFRALGSSSVPGTDMLFTVCPDILPTLPTTQVDNYFAGGCARIGFPSLAASPSLFFLFQGSTTNVASGSRMGKMSPINDASRLTLSLSTVNSLGQTATVAPTTAVPTTSGVAGLAPVFTLAVLGLALAMI